MERPDYWLSKGNPWEVERLDVVFPVRFYGQVVSYQEGGKTLYKWEGGEVVRAVAYDTPIPGYGTLNTNTMRLWSAYVFFTLFSSSTALLDSFSHKTLSVTSGDRLGRQAFNLQSQPILQKSVVITCSSLCSHSRGDTTWHEKYL